MKLSLGAFLLSAVAVVAAMPSAVEPKLEYELTISKDVSIVPLDNAHISARQNPGENVSCYNIGTSVDRGAIVAAVDDFCGRIMGTVLERATITLTYNYGTSTIRLWGQAINDCRWAVDANCNRLLRYPVDNCNTATAAKQGGYVTDRCGIWGVDPGSNGSDF